jgi:hypothetical protein
MQEQTNGTWRAYEDAQHNTPHECKKNQGGPQNSGTPSSPTRTLDSTGPSTNSSTETSKKGPEPGFSDLQQEVIRRIVVDELKKRLRSLFE